MSRNLWKYALLGGIAEGAEGYGQALAQQRQIDAQREMRREAAAENERLTQMRIDARGGSSGGSSGGSTARPAIFQSPDEQYQFMTAEPTDEEIASRIRASGGQVVKQLGAESGDASQYDRTTDIWQEKRQELQDLRKRIGAGPNADDFAKADATDAETRRLQRVEGGSRGATVAQLASKGQGEMDSLGGGAGIFSKVGREQHLNDKGRADAEESRAKGRAAVTRAEREPEDPEVENRRREAERRRQQAAAEATEKAAAKALKDHEESSKGKTPEEKAAWEKTRADLKARLESARAAAGGAKPGAPAQSGSGKSYEKLWN